MSAATCSQCGSANLKNLRTADGRQQIYCQECNAYKILETWEALRTQEQSQHLKNLYHEKFKRLCVLELQAAQYGINVRPEVVTEIDSIKSELRQLENQIQMTDLHFTTVGHTPLNTNHVLMPIPLVETQRIEIRIKGELDINDQIPPYLLSAAIRAFAAVLDICEEQIEIVNVRHGSIILTIDIPKAAAEKLLTLYKEGDRIIQDLGIYGIQPDQGEAVVVQDIVLLGAPGSGKSTYAQVLEEHTGLDRIQSKAARLRRIEHRLYNVPRGLRATELADYCGVDRRTIYRDLQALEEMGVPVWEDQGRYGIDRQSYLSTVRLNLNEAVALLFAARLLAHHSDEHNPNVVSALSKLAASLPDTTISTHMARVAEIIRSRPLRADYVRVLDTITRAWADRRQVAIRYRAASGELTQRVISPYFLEVSRSEPASYVIAHDDLRGALRTFKIERIVAAEILDSSYTIPDDFDPYTHLAAAWGVMDEVEVEVRLRFSPAAAPRVRESVWHHSQRLDDTPDGGCELTMRVGGIKEVRAWVLGWGGDVEVLAPQALRDEVRMHARRMLERYERTGS